MSKFLIGTIFCLLFTVIGLAQTTKSAFYVTGKVKVEQGVVDNTHIQVFRDGTLLNTIGVNNTGNFRVPLELNHVYIFKIGKEGYYSKDIEVDANVPKEVCDQNCSFPPYQLALLLYKTVPGVPEPKTQVGRISYNPKIDNFDAEFLRTNIELKENVQKMLSETKEQSKKYEEQSQEAKKDKYRTAISEADLLYNSKDYEKAMLRYRDAVLLFPEIMYPRNRVNQLYQLMIDEELKKTLGEPTQDNFLKYVNYADKKLGEREFSMAKVTYEKALKIKPDDEKVKNKLFNANTELLKMNDLAISEVTHRKEVYSSRVEKYNALIAKGDEMFLVEEFAKAKDYFAQAVTQIDENSYSLLMIEKIDAILGNNDAALKLAQERQEAETQRLREARNKAYTDAINEADRLFSERLYRDAQEYYELALTIKNFELYPQQQIRKIKDILADLQLRGEDYNRLLREGEAYMKEKDYLNARNSYSKAHSLIENEKFAQSKIEEIDRILNDLKDEEKSDKEYRSLLQQADNLANQKKYTDAIAVYQSALRIKPLEEFPKTEIKRIREILSREEDVQKRKMQLQTDYEKTIVLADEAFLRQSYMPARSLYQEALQLIAGQEYPISQIEKIDQQLREKKQQKKEQSKLDQIDFSNLDKISDDIRKAAYDEAMQLGNSFIETNEWGLARFYFRRALALYTADQPATQKLALVDSKIRGGNVDEAKYNELIKNAEEAFKTGDFSIAKFYFSKAHELKPNDTYTNDRLQIVNKFAESAAQRNADNEFSNTMDKANEAMKSKNYSVARFFYRKALSLKPTDEQAKSKLSEVEAIIGK